MHPRSRTEWRRAITVTQSKRSGRNRNSKCNCAVAWACLAAHPPSLIHGGRIQTHPKSKSVLPIELASTSSKVIEIPATSISVSLPISVIVRSSMLSATRLIAMISSRTVKSRIVSSSLTLLNRKMSSPASPLRISSPPSPNITSSPLPPNSLSSCRPPFMVSAPRPA